MSTCVKNSLMTEEEFALLRDLIQDEFGIFLKGDKRLTLHTRISHRVRILGLANYKEYYDYILADPSREELFIFASHVTNNETYFFRERAQLEIFAELLKEVKRNKQSRGENTVRVLSLASSSGEEAYSINMLFQEAGLFLWDWDIRITGMDIDRNALQKAAEARYGKNSFRSQNGDAELVRKYFTVEGQKYQLRSPLVKNVEFRHGNILDAVSFSGLGPADAVFCRNVLIYMSDEAIGRIARNIYDVLSDTGYLFIGASESLIQKTNLFAPEYTMGVIVYRKNRNVGI